MPKKDEKQKSGDDAGQAEMQDMMDTATKQGFIGTEVDPIPNSAYSLQSGPDSPTIDEQREALAKKQSEENKSNG